MKTMSFNPLEKRALLGLVTITFLRMFGLFLVMPVISLYANGLIGATPVLVGATIGCYGLTQSLLQIPFGLLSDKYGRRPIILFGLGLFAMGSALAAMAHTIWGLIIARALQGSGAISSAVIAYLADLTREEVRTKAVAVMGGMIGVAFIVATMMAPVFQDWIGMQGIFAFTIFLALVSMVILLQMLPDSTHQQMIAHRNDEVKIRDIPKVAVNAKLWRLNVSIMILHGILAMTFVALPFIINEQPAITQVLTPLMRNWLYAPVLLVSFLFIAPLMMSADRKGRNKPVMLFAILLMATGLTVLSLMSSHIYGLVIGLLAFFGAFILLEAMLPSWISRVAPKQYKGTALGIYSSCQFLGIFIGGLSSGYIMHTLSITAVFAVSAVLCVVWLLLAMRLTPPIIKHQ